MDKGDLVLLLFIGAMVGLILNAANLLDMYRTFGSAMAHGVAQYIYIAIFSSSFSAGLITWAIMKYRYKRAIELWKKFQIPG